MEAVLQALLKREALAAAAADPHWLAAQLSGRLAAARSRLLSWLRMAALYHSYSVITAEHAANFLDRYLACTASAVSRRPARSGGAWLLVRCPLPITTSLYA